MGKKITKQYRLVRGNFNLRDDESGRVIRQAVGAVCDLTENQARAFRDMFEPVGKGFDGIVNMAPVSPAAPAQPSQPKPKVIDVSDQDEPVEVEVEAEVVANTMSANDTIAAMKAAATVAEVEALAESEDARSKPRPSVLDAADKAIDALCLIEPA